MDESPESPFTIEHLLGLGDARYSAVEVTEKAGLDLEQAKRLWRAMGFVVVPDEEVFFTEADLETLKLLAGFMGAGYADVDIVLGITRVMSLSVSRITEAQADAIRHRLAAAPELLERILGQSEDQVNEEVFRPLEEFLVYVWKRQLANALQRAQVFEVTQSASTKAIGFVDMVGFTRLSRELSEDELARLVEDFETSAQDAAAEAGVRIVKTIGDEAMFVSDEIREAVEMALLMANAYSDPDRRTQVRSGVAFGEVTAHHGDYFGETVNLASRAVTVARPGAVLVSEELAEALAEDHAYEVKPIARRRLKGIGNVQLFVLRRRADGSTGGHDD